WVSHAVEAAAGAGTRLERASSFERFDILPLLVPTDGANAAFGHDRRRLRPNIVIGGVAGLGGREWEGQALRAGATVIGMRDLRQRCIMTTFDPDTLEQDVGVLKEIHRRFGGSLALNSYVVRGGSLSVGDTVELIDGGFGRAGRSGRARALLALPLVERDRLVGQHDRDVVLDPVHELRLTADEELPVGGE